MTALETELKELKDDVLDMISLVKVQLENTVEAITRHDTDMAEAVIAKDKKVNAADLRIDKQAERLLALYTPVATDLRFILASLKINTFLERMGDNAKSVGEFIVDIEKPFDKELLKEIQLDKMAELVIQMVDDATSAYEQEDLSIARKIFVRDKKLNKINEEASGIILPYIAKNPEKGRDYLYLLSTIRKLERVGDLAKNIVEETIFYIDAKVLKHKKKKQQSFTKVLKKNE